MKKGVCLVKTIFIVISMTMEFFMFIKMFTTFWSRITRCYSREKNMQLFRNNAYLLQYNKKEKILLLLLYSKTLFTSVAS